MIAANVSGEIKLDEEIGASAGMVVDDNGDEVDAVVGAGIRKDCEAADSLVLDAVAAKNTNSRLADCFFENVKALAMQDMRYASCTRCARDCATLQKKSMRN